MPQKTQSRSFSLTRRFLPYYRKYWKMLVFDLFCASLTTVCDLALPMIVRYITNTGMNDLAALTVSIVLRLGGLYLVLRAIDTAANFYMQSTGHIMGTYMETDMRRDLFSHLQRLPHAYYDEAKVGQIMARITSDLFDVTEFAHHCPEEFFIASIKLVASFVILCTMNVYLTLTIFLILPFMILCSAHFNHKLREAFKAQRHQIGELNAQVEDSLLGVRVVRSFANEALEEQKFEQGNQKILAIKKKTYYFMAGFNSSTRMFDGLMYIVVVVVGALFMIKRQITPADLVAYLLYVTTLLTTIRRIVEYAEQFQRGMTGIERFLEIMDQPVTIQDAPDARELRITKGEIDFDHVSFAYSDALGNVLTNINLHVPAGQSVALVGPSGGGKTTLCSLIPRFYEVTGGAVRIDGQDVREVTLHSLRAQVGVVQQDVYLFSGTVGENIAYGKPGATREEIIEAARLAGAHEFISQLKNGYDTYVGEHGVKLSGGQKQRISIARVFLKNPPILILDEATSALDNESEHLVQQSLERLAVGRTTFTIAHRLTTIQNADVILVLTEKGIEEQGTHEELLAKKGLYYNLYKMYAKLA